MRFSVLSLFLLAASQLGKAGPLANCIDEATDSELERYAEFSSGTYQILGCPKPLGTKLVKTINRLGTQGYITRDDKRKEIIVAFRGSLSPVDFAIDLAILPAPLVTPGVTDAEGAFAHIGFQTAYNVVADEVVSTVKGQASTRPDYKIVVTGHSLGGAVASIAAISLKTALPSTDMKLFTYGQPRVGNKAFARLVEHKVGIGNIFRATHTWDGVPTILPKGVTSIGYRHFANEYWNHQDPASPQNTRKCMGGDDPTCSDSIPSTFINPPHLVYFNQVMALDPSLCF
ncbi:lipase [Coprinopsis sp. MPI-PUGE-AT-0042]|nr:lipase [Coprinopsis sp. MPI-PUGE-AT-0042]